MAAIYDKALKRKDYSGIILKTSPSAEETPKPAVDAQPKKKETRKERKARQKAEKEKANKADDPKAGADVGKIVNLMAGDANRVC